MTYDKYNTYDNRPGYMSCGLRTNSCNNIEFRLISCTAGIPTWGIQLENDNVHKIALVDEDFQTPNMLKLLCYAGIWVNWNNNSLRDWSPQSIIVSKNDK